jgi:signal transduction histidine kinase
MLTIANTGPEVHAEDIERLFEPFRRFAADRGNADGHHGLGLSIVRAVATAHDATVTASPEPGGGLAMTVSFAS